MSNNNALSELYSNIKHAVNISALRKLNPMFGLKPKPKISGNAITVRYELSEPIYKYREMLYPPSGPKEKIIKFEEIETDPIRLSIPYRWLILTKDNFALRIEDKNEPEVNFYRLEKTPIYIRCFHDAIKKSYKKSIILISERLPLDPFYISIITEFDKKNEYKLALEIIAEHTLKNKDETIEVEIKRIINNKKDSFTTRLDKLINLDSKTAVPPDYSYCLCCGERVKKDIKFCNINKNSKSIIYNRSNCLRKFKYKIKSGLGITNNEESAELRDKLYIEMLKLVAIYRLSAFEQFKINHVQLFESKKRGTKPKIKN